MLRTWNPAFLAASAVRWAAALLVVLPAGIVLGAFLGIVWLLWATLLWVQTQALGLRLAVSHAGPAGAPASRTAGQRRTRMLPPVATRRPVPPDAPTRQVQSRGLGAIRAHLDTMIAARADKAAVIAELEAGGARWAWSDRIVPGALHGDRRVPPTAREHVHLVRRTGGMFDLVAQPVEIDVFLDGAGRLVYSRVWQSRRVP